jgi:MFS family permease
MLAGMARAHAWQVLIIGLGTSVVPLDSALNIAFPAITRAFDLPIVDIQWVVICYVLTYASLMLAFGRIGDMLGHAAVFRAGLIWSTAALALCAMAPSYGWLLFFRFLQGIGAALVLSCGAALVTSLYDEDRRSRVLGIYTMMFAIGGTVGPLIGGALTATWDWPAVFWFRAPMAAAALVLLGTLPAPERSAVRQPFDLPGAALLVLALATMLLAVNRIGELLALPLGLISLIAFAGFGRREARCEKPIIDLKVFRLPGFLALNLANVLTNLAGFSVWLLVPFYLARATDLGVAASGAILATASAGAIVASPAGGRLIGRFAAERLALVGAVLVAGGLFSVGTWDGGAKVPWLIATLVVQGVGLGLFQIATTDIVTASIPRQDRGVAGSLVMVTRTVGTVSAAAVVMLLFQALQRTETFLTAFQHTFRLAAVLPFVMAVLMAWRGRAKALPRP